MHHVDRRTRWEEIWEAFAVLRQQGKVTYFDQLDRFDKIFPGPGDTAPEAYAW